MLVRGNQRLRLLPFDLPTPRVSFPCLSYLCLPQLICDIDANLFKEAFLKAQQENEILFSDKS